MNHPLHCLAALAALAGLASSAIAAQPKGARVPSPGLEVSEKDRAELRAGADALLAEINSLRSGRNAELLPDVEIFHKAVDWALRYDEFYRSNEVGLAHSLLKHGMERARELHGGKPSWPMATGLVVRGYVSKIDGSVQPYGLIVPAPFAADEKKARRLDVWLHGRDDKLTELKFISDRERSYGEFTPTDALVLHPYGRYCNAFKFAGEADVLEALEHVKKSYRIDGSRVALRGFSMGGAGAWHLAAHHPDVWAVAAPGAGFAETAEYQKISQRASKPPAWEQKLWGLYDATDYAANFFNLPVVAYNGTLDDQRQAADVMARAMGAEGLVLPRVWGTNAGHKYTPEGKREVSQFVDDVMTQGKPPSPAQVHFTTRTLRFNRSVGVEVLGLKKHWERADVVFDHAARSVRTTNITAFVLSDLDTPNFTVDGQSVPVTIPQPQPGGQPRAVAFKLTSEGAWSAVRAWSSYEGRRKSPGRQGPIDDAFMDGFLVVRPTGRAQSEGLGAWISSQLAKATNDWRAQFRGDARVKDDTQVTDADIANHNLILWGDPQSNQLLARIVGGLPIQWNTRVLRVGARTFSATTHLPALICPNPLNPNRYVVLNSGFTFAGVLPASNAQQTPKLPDYAVFDVANAGAIVLADFFDEEWRVK